VLSSTLYASAPPHDKKARPSSRNFGMWSHCARRDQADLASDEFQPKETAK
jgi:hypothetical protein